MLALVLRLIRWSLFPFTVTVARVVAVWRFVTAGQEADELRT